VVRGADAPAQQRETTMTKPARKTAAKINDKMEDIGARRLYTIMERLLDEVSFDAPDLSGQEIVIDAGYVKKKLEEFLKDEDLSRYIL
jgi:ATP-dependent HslUV protease ATP-binding subunit HslU